MRPGLPVGWSVTFFSKSRKINMFAQIFVSWGILGSPNASSRIYKTVYRFIGLSISSHIITSSCNHSINMRSHRWRSIASCSSSHIFLLFRLFTVYFPPILPVCSSFCSYILLLFIPYPPIFLLYPSSLPPLYIPPLLLASSSWSSSSFILLLLSTPPPFQESLTESSTSCFPLLNLLSL